LEIITYLSHELGRLACPISEITSKTMNLFRNTL